MKADPLVNNSGDVFLFFGSRKLRETDHNSVICAGMCPTPQEIDIDRNHGVYSDFSTYMSTFGPEGLIFLAMGSSIQGQLRPGNCPQYKVMPLSQEQPAPNMVQKLGPLHPY